MFIMTALTLNFCQTKYKLTYKQQLQIRLGDPPLTRSTFHSGGGGGTPKQKNRNNCLFCLPTSTRKCILL